MPSGSISRLNPVAGNDAMLQSSADCTNGTTPSTSQSGMLERSVVVRLPVSMVWCLSV